MMTRSLKSKASEIGARGIKKSSRLPIQKVRSYLKTKSIRRRAENWEQASA